MLPGQKLEQQSSTETMPVWVTIELWITTGEVPAFPIKSPLKKNAKWNLTPNQETHHQSKVKNCQVQSEHVDLIL
jgi:hypothetical protein